MRPLHRECPWVADDGFGRWRYALATPQFEGPALEECLQQAYEGVVRPLSDLARAHGYLEWWRTGFSS